MTNSIWVSDAHLHHKVPEFDEVRTRLYDERRLVLLRGGAEVFRPVERALVLDDEGVAHLLAALTAGDKRPRSKIQVALAGTWRGHSAGEFTFDEDAFGEIVANFKRTKNGQVPLDFEHASEAGMEGSVPQRGAPAQGWIVDLSAEGDRLMGVVEWIPSQPGLGYVREGAYKFFSPAVVFSARDRATGKPIGAELVSGALTNRPFLDGMAPVEASRRARGAPMTVESPAVTCGAVKYAAAPVVDRAWDGAAAKRRLAARATTDGKMDFAKYGEGFAYVAGAGNHKSDYKLPHHDVIGGQLVTSRKGVFAAAAALVGSRGGLKGISDEDRRAVEAHLGEHYKAMSLQPPWERDGKPMTSSDDEDATAMDDSSEDEDAAEMSAGGLPEEKRELASRLSSRARDLRGDDAPVLKFSDGGVMSFGEVCCEVSDALCDATWGSGGSLYGLPCGYCYVREVFAKYVVYEGRDGCLYKIGYRLVDDGDGDGLDSVVLTGEPTKVQVNYLAVEATARNSQQEHKDTMANEKIPTAFALSRKMADALGVTEVASEEKATEAAVTLRDDHAKLLSAHKLLADSLAATMSSLGLGADAKPADAVKAIGALTTKAAKLDEIEPKFAELSARADADAKKVGEAEIDWVIKNGAKYNLSVAEGARGSLRAHRQLDPKDFAQTYKAALDGMAAGDDPALFSRVAAPGGSAGSTPRTAAPTDPAQTAEDRDAAFERRVATFSAERKVSLNEARTAVHKQLTKEFA